MTDELSHGLDEARWLWEQASHVQRLHLELAVLYRQGGKDKRSIRTLWQHIEEGEAALRAAGIDPAVALSGGY